MYGVITSDYFPTIYFGVPVDEYDTTKNAGKKFEYHGIEYLHEIAHSLLHGEDKYEMFPEYEARAIKYFSEFEGKEVTTHGIFKKA